MYQLGITVGVTERIRKLILNINIEVVALDHRERTVPTGNYLRGA